MRILHLLSQTQLTGAEVYAQQLIDWQVSEGHHVFVISDKIHVPLKTAWTSMPLSKSKIFDRISTFFKLRSFLKTNKIELLHCHSRGAVRHASLARKFLPVAMVTTVHGKQHSSWSKRLIDSYGEYKILICENLFRQFEMDFKISRRTLRLLRNPFSTKDFHFQDELPARVRWAFVGRSTGPKGERLRELFANGLFEYLKSHPHIEFDLIAPHPENWGDDLLKKLRTLGHRVQVLGEVHDLKSHLKNYQVVLAAGRVAMEALLTGIQVIGFGEAESLGLITGQNFDKALTSNFGDISSGEVSSVDSQLLLQALDRCLNTPLNKSERMSLRTAVANQYNGEAILPLILETYKAALFKRRTPRWIPIFMYHKIPSTEIKTQHRIFVTAENFKQHLEFFKKKNCTTLGFSDLLDFWNGTKDYAHFPRRPLLLTFDDGYVDNLENALPLLQQYNMKATIYLLADHRITENTWDLSPSKGSQETAHKLMSLEQKRQIAKSGVFEIGSHGIDHISLPKADDLEVLRQLKDSKKTLENDLNVEVLSFAYPFGDIDPRLPTLARAAGYSFAVNTDRGGLELSENPWSLFRVNIFPEDGPNQLRKKLSPWYRLYFWIKRGQ